MHRRDCSNFRHMAQRYSGRVIEVGWGLARSEKPALYALDVHVEAADRPGLLRDISEVFMKEKMNITGVNTQSTKDSTGTTARMTFTLEMADAARLAQVLPQVVRIAGVRHARRR